MYCIFNLLQNYKEIALQGFGYQDNLRIKNHEFTVHTGFEPDKGLAISEVFDRGKFIYASNNYYGLRKKNEAGIDEQYLKEVAYGLHRQVIEDIRILFYIHEKIRALRQANPHYRLGKIFFARNFYEEAVDNFTRAIQLDNKLIKAYKLLALIYLKQKKYQDATQLLEKAVSMEPDFPDLLNCLGVIHTHSGRFESARDVLQKALDIKEDFPEANFNLGVLLFLSTLQENSHDDTVVLPARVMRTFKHIREHEAYQSDEWQKLFTHTAELMETGNREAVIEALATLQLKLVAAEHLNVTMDTFFLKFMYGGKELKREEVEKFEKIFQEEGEQLNRYADYWNELGVIHLIQCRDYFLKALNEFERATKINPKYDAALNSLELMKHGKKGFLILLRAILR
ncbi:MAG TPA: tetratricopeptide repeat protein [Caldithrix abyssi]|uniref:Tetratricopeptide repeat protein n=1 Tax=Caldithrix abyssi TaxID=187145 RepID=A0A7V4WUA6_CALAY|nr:tetratricopeptide repeat protein [Caldithrix abyssi]